jgi:group I intron endonuclease
MINIYKITNSVNDKFYIGQTVKKIKTRFNQHLRQKSCKKLVRAIGKYGCDKFTIELLATCDGKDAANCIEGFYIQVYDTVRNGYNIVEFPSSNPMIGRKHSVETKKKMCHEHNMTQESRQKLSKQRVGAKPSEDTKRRSSESHKGKILSEEQKRKISNSAKGKNTWAKTMGWRLIDGKRVYFKK